MVNTEDLDGLVVEKIDEVANTKVTIIEKFLKIFLNVVGIEQDYQPIFFRKFWFKILATFFIFLVLCQFLKCFNLDNTHDIIQSLVFILHSVFANFNTFSIYLGQKYILEMVKIKEDHFSGFYKQSLVMRNYVTVDEKFKKFLIKFGTTTFVIHFVSSSILPFLHFVFSSKNFLYY